MGLKPWGALCVALAFAFGSGACQPLYGGKPEHLRNPVDPTATVALDSALLGQFPEGYRHLAYAQTRIGFTVKRDMPQLTGATVERLYADGAQWLAGAPLAR